jgi:Flp pilus assembly protein TadG
MLPNRLLSRQRRGQRRGSITVLAAVFSIVMLGMVAFSVDIGYILSVKEELQRTADAAAMAAAWEMASGMADELPADSAVLAGRAAAASVASSNVVGRVAPQIDANYANSASGDLVFGYLADLGAPDALDTSNSTQFNAARVKIRRDETLNGAAPLFFASVFGIRTQSLEAEATAGLVRNVGGFQAASGGENIDILPFALDRQTHLSWLAGNGADAYKYNESTGAVTTGCDGKVEVNLYPQGTGSPGNRGTVDIGGANNSTNDIARQILYGISPADFAALGKPLVFDEKGELTLNGDTGISAGVKDELAAIKGKPRIIPIFSKVQGPGNNAIYTIVAWQGIRIVDVQLTGPMNKKHVTIQAAPVLAKGVVPTTVAGTSYQVYSPAVLIQ